MTIRLIYKHRLTHKMVYLRRVLERIYPNHPTKNIPNYITAITILFPKDSRSREVTHWVLSEIRDERIYRRLYKEDNDN